jgi:2-polyprenyl-6-hydroxyphenyl methylase/3-demethylubiquinone-9 3-methyltransferase
MNSGQLQLTAYRAESQTPPIRFFTAGPLFVRLWGPTFLKDALKGDIARTWRSYGRNRGMSPWRDVVDWIGGFPFEVAKREDIIHFYETRGFRLLRLNSAGDGLGCNEFVFEKN